MQPRTLVPAFDGLHDARLRSFYVVTHVDVPGAVRDKGLAALTALNSPNRKDAGNLRFDVVHQKNRTNHFTVVEIWKGQRSNDAHELAAHTRAFRAALTPITGALYDQRWYRPLEPRRYWPPGLGRNVGPLGAEVGALGADDGPPGPGPPGPEGPPGAEDGPPGLKDGPPALGPEAGPFGEPANGSPCGRVFLRAMSAARWQLSISWTAALVPRSGNCVTNSPW